VTLTIDDVRRAVVGGSLLQPTGLNEAVARAGFVQADPIRAPARAQDLILRHRVAGYRAGDLERRYPELGIDEDFLYAYGFVSPETRALLHPRGGRAPAGLAREILAFVREHGPTHPRVLLATFGKGRVVNAWGGQSHSTTRLLERLHFTGHLRVARREKGVRVYESAPAPAGAPALTPNERMLRIVLAVSRVLGPLPERSLRATVGLLRYTVPKLPGRSTAVTRLLRSGELERGEVDGVTYVWTAGSARGGPRSPTLVDGTVRFLAPFDPIVWDRRRFEHLWGWPYRFEAYTPVAKRQFGYYALPLLWEAGVVGWVNLSLRAGRLDVAPGFVARRPKERAFARAFDEEVARVEAFLGVSAAASR
jgi:uncharacterized protein YcaQ